VLVMGGSQGARSINEAAAQLVRRGLPAGWQLLHLSGERDYGAIRACEREAIAGGAVRLFPYLDDLAAAYAAADIAVARAGASTLAELAATGTPSLLIPYPYAAEHHQDRNAALFASAGAARILADAGLDGAQLRAALEEALHPQVLRRLRESACSLGSADPNGAINARIALLLSSGNPRT
jgi:UDP-N-acetylglucosamine--N-acetylmuramyl-(pentapeptide) pyrophosphoryl-undecaprenol N-acetylglucosamine transferase